MANQPLRGSEQSRPKSQSRYFTLPPEIRNMIARLLVVPGKVYLRDPHDHGPTAIARSEEPATSFGYLLTSRQFHEEGIMLFYTENIFHLPPGDAQCTRTYLEDTITPQHRAWIRRFRMTLSTSDPSDVDFSDPRNAGLNSLLRLCCTLMETWFAKVSCAVGRDSIDEVAHAGEPTIELEGLRGSEEAEFPHASRWLNQDAIARRNGGTVVAKSTLIVYELVKTKMLEVGWQRTREWFEEEMRHGSLGT